MGKLGLSRARECAHALHSDRAAHPSLHRLDPGSNLRRPSSGRTKYSISICSNSISRKMKLPGVISLRNALPIWPMPNGNLTRDGGQDVLVLDEHRLRRFRAADRPRRRFPQTGPMVVLNIMLNWRASVSVRLPHFGHGRIRLAQDLASSLPGSCPRRACPSFSSIR